MATDERNGSLLFAPHVPQSDRLRISQLTRAERDEAADGRVLRGRRWHRTAAVAAVAAGVVAVGAVWDSRHSAVLQRALIILFLPVALLSVVMVVMSFVGLGLAANERSPKPPYRQQAAAHKWRGQYLGREAFNAESQQLLERLQDATSQIAGVKYAAEFLDDTASPESHTALTWQVAQDLAEYTRLRRSAPRAKAPDIAEATRQTAMLDEKFASTRRLVEATEELSRTVLAKDKELQAERKRTDRAARAADRLDANRDPVLNLAAGAARDEIAVADAKRLVDKLTGTRLRAGND